MVSIRAYAGNWRAYLAGGGLVLATLPQLSEAAQTPEVRIEQEAQRQAEHANYSQTEKHNNDQTSISSRDNEEERKLYEKLLKDSEGGTEFWPSFFGIRLKITDSLIAAFTFVLAIVTGGLWFATHRLWMGAEEQSRDFKVSLELTRKQFIATHRPRLKISDMVAQPFVDGNPIRISYAIVNIGDSSAKVVEVLIRLLTFHKADRFDGSMRIPTDKINDSDIVLVSGQMAGVEYSSPEIRSSFLGIEFGDYIIYAYGGISYTDENETRRRMGFLRRWDVTSSRFRAVDDPDYEYQD